ncbi:MAG: hypothetical protein R6X13_12625 [bacterium]
MSTSETAMTAMPAVSAASAGGAPRRASAFQPIASAEPVTVEFDLRFDEPGFHELRAVADSIPGESNAADNAIEGLVHVRPGRILVRYVRDAFGPSSRFVVRALRSLSRVSVDTAIVVGEGGPTRTAAAVDVYVLDVALPATARPGWKRFAAEVGPDAAVLILGGDAIEPDHPLAAFLPGGTARIRSTTGPPTPTSRAGRPAAELDLTLERLSPPDPLFTPISLDSFDPWIVDGSAGLVIVGARRAGRRRVLYAGGPVWRWSFTAGSIAGAPTALELLLGAAVRHLVADGSEALRLSAARTTHLAGEPVRLELAALAPDGTPLSGAAPIIELGAAGVRLPMMETRRGLYSVEFAGATPGRHEAVAVVENVGQARVEYLVTNRLVEDVALGLDDRLLRGIAQASGGRYFRYDSLPGPGFEMELAASRHGFEFTPRRIPWFYIMLVLLAAAEWALRRKEGLR